MHLYIFCLLNWVRCHLDSVFQEDKLWAREVAKQLGLPLAQVQPTIWMCDRELPSTSSMYHVVWCLVAALGVSVSFSVSCLSFCI